MAAWADGAWGTSNWFARSWQLITIGEFVDNTELGPVPTSNIVNSDSLLSTSQYQVIERKTVHHHTIFKLKKAKDFT